jgi:hypothetical protein
VDDADPLAQASPSRFNPPPPFPLTAGRPLWTALTYWLKLHALVLVLLVVVPFVTHLRHLTWADCLTFIR